MPMMILRSIAARRNSGEFLSGARASASARCDAALEAAVSSHCATSNGEYLPVRCFFRDSTTNSLIVENICGSRELTLPKTLGAGVSLYGEGFEASTID